MYGRRSAVFAGVELVVLGLGEPYVRYDDKLKRYYSYLHDSALFDVADNDIVLLFDAYDVLLFPEIRRIHEVFARSLTPILACAESGIYPEPMVKIFQIYLISE